MSLLDDVSIVVTPNGYKAGELYAVVPEPTEGAEMLSQPVDLQTDFTTHSGGVIVDADTFTTSGGSIDGIKKSSFLTVGTRYKLIIEGNTTSSGFTMGNFSASGNEYGSGFGTHIFTASVDTTLWLRQNTAGTTNITSFSIKEYTAADMDVTRATAATRVDENGLVNYAEVLGSDVVTNGNFTTDLSDWNITGNDATHTVTWTATGARYQSDTTSPVLGFAQASLEVGKIYKVTCNIAYAVGSGTLRCSIGGVNQTAFTEGFNTRTSVASSFTSLSFLRDSTNVDVIISNVSVKEVTRDNVPRIDYTGGGCPHILAEPQRTNELTQSNQFDTTWSQSGTLTSGQDGVGGSTDAWKFENPNPTSGLFQNDTTSGVQTFSAYFKKNSNYGVRFYAFGSVNCSTYFDLDNGAVVSSINSTAKVESAGADWFRCSMTFDQTNTQCYFYVTNNASTQVLGNITLQYAQLEQGSYATSYIPTSGSTVTRNQDIFTRDGIGSLINSTEGCVFGEGNFAESNSSIYNYFVSLSDGTPNNRLEIRQSVSNLQFLWRVATYQSEISTSSLDVSGNFKFALNYSAANIKFYVNGNLIGTINTPTLWSANTLNRLAFDNGAGGDRLSGKVKQLQVYTTALTDEQLLQLTGESGTDFYESYAEMAAALTYTIQ
jgi:hypothetical protein